MHNNFRRRTSVGLTRKYDIGKQRKNKININQDNLWGINSYYTLDEWINLMLLRRFCIHNAVGPTKEIDILSEQHKQESV